MKAISYICGFFKWLVMRLFAVFHKGSNWCLWHVGDCILFRIFESQEFTSYLVWLVSKQSLSLWCDYLEWQTVENPFRFFHKAKTEWCLFGPVPTHGNKRCPPRHRWKRSRHKGSIYHGAQFPRKKRQGFVCAKVGHIEIQGHRGRKTETFRIQRCLNWPCHNNSKVVASWTTSTAFGTFDGIWLHTKATMDLNVGGEQSFSIFAFCLETTVRLRPQLQVWLHATILLSFMWLLTSNLWPQTQTCVDTSWKTHFYWLISICVPNILFCTSFHRGSTPVSFTFSLLFFVFNATGAETKNIPFPPKNVPHMQSPVPFRPGVVLCVGHTLVSGLLFPVNEVVIFGAAISRGIPANACSGVGHHSSTHDHQTFMCSQNVQKPK